jgi:NADH-ubiquinone oxidoreductase chain 5
MEGPTPVSALIHAATLVVAGVFLIIRCSALFDNSCTALFVVSIVGAITSFFAASVGLFQNDLKRVIAYSTCSQLGYMIFISGLSHYSVSLFHLANHAVFKALLFLSAGCVIHGLSDEQDLRKMGGLRHIFPVSYTMILIGSLALIGTPFLTGFYSKDCILEIAIAKQSFTGNFCYFLGCCAAFCTAFYSFRLVFLAFVNKTNTFKVYMHSAHEAPIKMIFPLMILAAGAIFHGFLTRDIVIGLGCLLFNSIFINYYNFILIDSEFLPAFIKNIPLIFTIAGVFLSVLLINCFNVNKQFVYNLKLVGPLRYVYIFLNKKWHFDQLANELIVMKSMNFGYSVSFLAIDKGFIEQFGPTGFAKTLFHFSYSLSNKQNGSFFYTIFSIVLFVIIILSYYFASVFCIT